jgi:protein-disulfide isomerase
MEQFMKLNRRFLLGTVFTTGAVTAIGFAGLPNPFVQSAYAQSVDLSDINEEPPLGDMVLGEADAPITIIEYASLTCPHCAHFHNEVLPAIKENYIDTGKAKLIFREFPLDKVAYAASMLSRCAGDQAYFPMTDVLFKQQSTWARAEDPRMPLLQISKLAGFTQESFMECLSNKELAAKLNETIKKASEEYGVSGTPTFFINGEKYSGKRTVEGMSEAIESEL